MINLKRLISPSAVCLSLLIMAAVSVPVLASDGPTLPEYQDIFTIAFNVNGLRKESRDIYSKEALSRALSKADYLGRFHLQITSWNGCHANHNGKRNPNIAAAGRYMPAHCEREEGMENGSHQFEGRGGPDSKSV